MRTGLEPVEEALAARPISVRLYLRDMERIEGMRDRSGFVREAVRAALGKGEGQP